MNWMNVKHFTAKEFACKCGNCGGAEDMNPEFMTLLDEMRDRLNRPMTITSGYRCREHPEEAKKALPGAHNQGTAADIAVSGGSERFEIISIALEVGMLGLGVANSFVHVDLGHETTTRPMAWKY